MQKKLLKGLALLLAMSGLLFFVSCAQTDVQPTTPDAPKAQITDQDEMMEKDAAAEAANQEAERRAIEEEAIRKEQEAARNMFISEDIYFDYDDSSLKSSAQTVIQRKAVWLRNNPDATVLLEGHCDDRGTTEYNLALGDRRANSAKTFLVDMGIESSRLRTISYGEEMPVDPGKNEEAWAKNRRVHFTIE
ncbi:MAG: peptidoglycan-associated lipoprotein Pal [Pseudomonadota bacterium]